MGRGGGIPPLPRHIEPSVSPCSEQFPFHGHCPSWFWVQHPPSACWEAWNVLSLAFSRSLDSERPCICIATSQGGALPCVLAAPCGLPTAGSERSPATPDTLVTPRLALLTPSQPTAEAVNHTTTASWHTHPSELVPGPCARWKVTNAVSQMRNCTAAEAEGCRLLDFSSC